MCYCFAEGTSTCTKVSTVDNKTTVTTYIQVKHKVDLVESEEGSRSGENGEGGGKSSISKDYDTSLAVVMDGVSAIVRCMVQPEKDLFKSVVVEDCSDENVKKTLLRVVMNVMGSIQVRPTVE